jgi:menaquinone-dependent protoporphyrinogen oxidase
MSRILLIYSSIDGHTLKICHRLRQHLEQMGHSVALTAVDEAQHSELDRFDKIVIGASIRYGKHRPAVLDFVRTHAELLERKPSAFFSVNIVARKPEKNRPETNPYVRKFLQQVPWEPRLLGVFAGKLNYPAYGYIDRQMIRFIMLLTHGPTDPTTVLEFTDWQQVEAFAEQLGALG